MRDMTAEIVGCRYTRWQWGGHICTVLVMTWQSKLGICTTLHYTHQLM